MTTGPFTLNALFDRSHTFRGDALAIVDAHARCSYRELHARAETLAHALRARGVGRDDAVVIYAERSVASVIAIVAVLKAGGAFVPVSLDTPPARLAFILRDAGPKVLLTDRAGREQFSRSREGIDTAAMSVLSIDDTLSPPPPPSPLAGVRSEPATEVAVAVAPAPADLAYIIYTSGTSGHPKGVMIEHGSIARRFHDWDRVFELRAAATCRILQVSRFGFDVFTADVVKALGAGGVLIICPNEAVLDPAHLYRWLIDEAIDYIDIVPAVLRPLIDHLETTGQNLASVRILNCGADLWTKKEYQRSRQIAKVGRLYNSYGVTECTVENTMFVDETGTMLDDRNTLPIGRAAPSDVILIVDDALTPVPPGVTGQICIGGPCVARGYLNRPELNARAFFERESDAGPIRFYQTGDLGRMDAQGIIEFLGRQDFQIKINGHRIELEEIESVLERLPAVAQAIVCFDAPRKLLTACVRTVDGEALSAIESTAYVARHLPHYMVPGRIVTVDRFPLTPNGKVDRIGLANELASMPDERRTPTSATHDLHESRTVAELSARLAQRDIDLIALVNEFVKPSASFALHIANDSVAATPSSSSSPSSPVSPSASSSASAVALRVVLKDVHAMKRSKREVSGHPVHYLSASGDADTRLCVSIRGLDIRLHFTASSC